MPLVESRLGEFARSRYQRTGEPSIRLVKLNKLAAAVRPGDRVLDLGCGAGILGRELAKRRIVSSYVGIDFVRSALALARVSGLTIVTADLSQRLPLASSQFDLVFAVEIIEHLVDTDAFLQETRRVLMPSGRLVLTTPNAASLGRRVLLAMGRNPHLEFALGPKDAGHLRYFVGSTLRELCGRNGFTVRALESDYVNLDDARRLGSAGAASLFPGLGGTLIAFCERSPD